MDEGHKVDVHEFVELRGVLRGFGASHLMFAHIRLPYLYRNMWDE